MLNVTMQQMQLCTLWKLIQSLIQNTVQKPIPLTSLPQMVLILYLLSPRIRVVLYYLLTLTLISLCAVPVMVFQNPLDLYPLLRKFPSLNQIYHNVYVHLHVRIFFKLFRSHLHVHRIALIYQHSVD